MEVKELDNLLEIIETLEKIRIPGFVFSANTSKIKKDINDAKLILNLVGCSFNKKEKEILRVLTLGALLKQCNNNGEKICKHYDLKQLSEIYDKLR